MVSEDDMVVIHCEPVVKLSIFRNLSHSITGDFLNWSY